MQIFANANYDFLKWRIHATVLFLIFIAIGLGWFAMNGLNMGIDFAGGANVILRFKDAVPLQELRSRVPNATIQQYGKAEENSVLIRLPQQEREGDYAGQVVTTLHRTFNPDAGQKLDLNFQGRAAIAELLKSADPDRKGTAPAAHDYYYNVAQSIITRRSELGLFTSQQQVNSSPGLTPASAQVLGNQTVLGRFNVLSQETVGPQVGRELQQKAILAIILSALAMGIYIAIRFDVSFGVAALIGLVHDVLFSFAFLALVGGEFSLTTVAAFLMIIGYSINDSVVIYDRVRENVKKSRVREDFETVLNRSLNQTLSRTILTGGCVMLILLALIFFGGEVIHDFALLLFVGTIIGTFSTLTVVPTVVLLWRKYIGKGATAGARPQVARPEAPPAVQAKAARRSR
jgi:preprotein translocase SecF subunit